MLIKLGVNRRDAIITGRSSRGPWTMSRTPVTQQAMSNAWLKAQGLVSVRERWIARAEATMNRPVRTRMQYMVWGGRERNPPLPDYARLLRCLAPRATAMAFSAQRCKTSTSSNTSIGTS